MVREDKKGFNQAGHQRFDHTQQQCGDDCATHVAHAAHDDDDERLQREQHACGGVERQDADEMIAQGGRVVVGAPGIYEDLVAIADASFSS